MRAPARSPGTRPGWTVRRRLVIATLLYCAIAFAYLMWAPPNATREAMIPVLGGVVTLVLGGYLGFATMDDRDIRTYHPTWGLSDHFEPRRTPPDMPRGSAIDVPAGEGD